MFIFVRSTHSFDFLQIYAKVFSCVWVCCSKACRSIASLIYELDWNRSKNERNRHAHNYLLCWLSYCAIHCYSIRGIMHQKKLKIWIVIKKWILYSILILNYLWCCFARVLIHFLEMWTYLQDELDGRQHSYYKVLSSNLTLNYGN